MQFKVKLLSFFLISCIWFGNLFSLFLFAWCSIIFTYNIKVDWVALFVFCLINHQFWFFIFSTRFSVELGFVYNTFVRIYLLVDFLHYFFSFKCLSYHFLRMLLNVWTYCINIRTWKRVEMNLFPGKVLKVLHESFRQYRYLILKWLECG